MKILTVDIGTGTQDIFLYNSELDLENGFKLVVPSPTMMVYRRIQEATRRGDPILLTGVTMGGGPSHWAARDHAAAGFPVYATEDAARTFDDDLSKVREEGIEIISRDEISSLPGSPAELKLRDFDFPSIQSAFSKFGVDLSDLDAAAAAVFDHGAAPPHISDRQFRFDYLADRLPLGEIPGSERFSPLSQLAFLQGEIPGDMTRLKAVELSASDLNAPLIVMDTAPAAVLGALLDPHLLTRQRVLVANIGNFHTLAFRLNQGAVEGVFEHHTGLLEPEDIEDLLRRFSSGKLSHEDVFGDHGHGAMLDSTADPYPLGEGDFDLAVTGPRRSVIRETSLRAFFPAPFGDMMLVGCFGLLAAAADLLPEFRDTILASLTGGGGSGTPPWEISP